ncbi:MAG TPA: hypothetical protein VF541_18820 [Longimicrobium sp.]|jgi:hypothetical protein
MSEQEIAELVAGYRSGERRRHRARFRGTMALVLVAEALLVGFVLRDLHLPDRLGITGSLLTVDALMLAWWQWRAQRREQAHETYFAHLDLPNQRRLAYFDKVITVRATASASETATALEQFYVFYMYAEIDNLYYALTKYADGDMSREMAERAMRTFLSRCRQSADFRAKADDLVSQSGYPEDFVAVVCRMVTDCSPAALPGGADPHPMHFDELETVRALRAGR